MRLYRAQLIKQDNEEDHDSECSSNMQHSQDEHMQAEVSDLKFDNNEKDQDEFVVSCVNVPEVSDVNLDASNSQDHNAMNISYISSSVNEESSIITSEMRVNIPVLPVPKNVQNY